MKTPHLDTRTRREAWVPTERVNALRARIERLTRRAERLGQEPPELAVGRRRRAGDGREELLVELVGEAPRLEHWEIVAELHHQDGGPNEIERLSGAAIDGGRWLGAAPRCDHCGLRRRRRTTVVLRHRSGQLAQVGTSCLADFTGERDPLARLVAARATEGAREALEQAASRSEYVDLREYLAQVCTVAAAEGFVSVRRAAVDGEEPTWSRALERIRRGCRLRPAERELAAELAAWVLHELAEREELGGCEERLVAVFQLGDAVPEESLPLVCSAWFAHERESSRAVRSEYAADVGETVVADVEVLDVRLTKRPSRYGPVRWHRLRDARGHELAWFAVGAELEVGSRVRLRGRVRRHAAFAGRAVTVLTGCRVVR
jgi:hypothetical protein